MDTEVICSGIIYSQMIRRPTETTHGQLDLFGGSVNAVQTQEIRKGYDCVKIIR